MPSYQEHLSRRNVRGATLIKNIDCLLTFYNGIVNTDASLHKIEAEPVTYAGYAPAANDDESIPSHPPDHDDYVAWCLLSRQEETRDFIHQRQKEGIEAAKLLGVRFGQKPLSIPEQYAEVKKLCETGDLSANATAKQLGVSRNNFFEWIKFVV